MFRKNQILEKIKQTIIKNAPQAKVYLYGSRATGNENKYSDWDILILLDTETISSKLEEKITYPLYDIEFETGEMISPKVYSEKEWFSKYKITPFYKNVMKNGILL
jgi:predicted nucleotidyltransferase